MYDTDHRVYPQLQKIGKEITEKVKPKGIVVLSAHWQGDLDVIEVNTAEKTDLIYEYVSLDSCSQPNPSQLRTRKCYSRKTD